MSAFVSKGSLDKTSGAMKGVVPHTPWGLRAPDMRMARPKSHSLTWGP
eukprot:CAMPEP_0170340720 /NCGR_PEP_ID=MMETSP0116_2-20130129/71471_1 /TAXON_ID=400756 /ORGANISM="Durinskia baltica, Strain CSIRO CS-38" /LENGTH=47 /DNA_ID= /DNA_START= /DNA_END= /DNA_ORIENTATION=